MATKPFQGVPNLIYGTAFAFDKTTSLVEAALKAGFRAIDTAGALGAYREKLVGDGIRNCVDSGTIKRSDLFVGLSHRLSRWICKVIDRTNALTRRLDTNQVLAL